MPDLGEWDDAKGSILDAGRGRPPALRYPTLDAFVQEFVVRELWVDVTVASRTWCPEWWRHSAAIVRLEALHRSFEHLRQDPAIGISTWLRDHADYHMGVLTDPNGIFKGCSLSKGHDAARIREISVSAAPEGLFNEGD
jgi:hypothetical protein